MHCSCSLMPEGVWEHVTGVWQAHLRTQLCLCALLHAAARLSLLVGTAWRSGCGSAIWGACTSTHTSVGAPPPMQYFLGANVGPSGRKQEALRVGFGVNSKGSSRGSCSMICCSVAQSCPTLCDPMDCSTPAFPVLHYVPKFAQTHVH